MQPHGILLLFILCSANGLEPRRITQKNTAATNVIDPTNAEFSDSGWIEINDNYDDFGSAPLVNEAPQLARTQDGSLVYVLPTRDPRRIREEQEETIDEILRLFDKLELQGRTGYIPGIGVPPSQRFFRPPPPPIPPPILGPIYAGPPPVRYPTLSPILPGPPPFSPQLTLGPPPPPYPLPPPPFLPPQPPTFTQRLPYLPPRFPPRQPFRWSMPPTKPESTTPLYRGPGGPLIVNPNDMTEMAGPDVKRNTLGYVTNTVRNSQVKQRSTKKAVNGMRVSKKYRPSTNAKRVETGGAFNGFFKPVQPWISPRSSAGNTKSRLNKY